MLTVRFTRISPTHHALECRVDGAAWERVENETRSTLEHDLVHYALESEVGLKQSFYGLLASGKSYTELSNAGIMLASSSANREVVQTERIVGGLTGVMQGKATPAQAIEGLENLHKAYEQPLPQWLTEATIVKVQNRFRKLIGKWAATPFHSSMELTFPSPSDQ